MADEYGALARKHGIDISQTAIAFCLSRPFLTSAIIGANGVEQLANIGAVDLDLSNEIMAEIAEIYRRHPIPM